jgi:cystathionine gamma-synthase
MPSRHADPSTMGEAPCAGADRVPLRLETIAVHAGAERDATGALAAPLYLSVNYEHGPAGERLSEFVYARVGNPVQQRLEAALAELENGASALVFASGVAAGAAYLQALPAGSHVLFPDDLFYGFRAMAPGFLPRWGIEWSSTNMTDLAAVRAALRPNTRAIWAETPSNPLLKITDIAAIAELAHGAGARLIVDSTFPTPALLRPLRLGADVTLHSTTKYLGGHSDVQGGALVFARDETLAPEIAEITRIRTLLGSVAAPFNSWLVLRGLRTLPARLRVHSANATAVAQALRAHPRVMAVSYPGLASHPGHAIASAQMRDFGGMLAFRVTGGRARALAVASAVRLFVNAGSLGGPESLIQHSASVMHPADGVPDDLLRLSIGLEHPDDLIADLTHALDAAD